LEYVPLEAEIGGFAAEVDRLRARGGRGLNITAGLGHWNQVSFLAIADFASGSAANDLSSLTRTGHSRDGGTVAARLWSPRNGLR
jgi:hypothetical protein